MQDSVLIQLEQDVTGNVVSHYELGETIGRGTFGKVKRGFDNNTKQTVACKIIDRVGLDSDSIASIEREIKILQLLRHPFIVHMKEAIATPRHFYIITDYIGGGELFDCIIAHGKLSEREAKRFFSQILLGVDYCHYNFVVHRDLKPENILLDTHRNVKIIDFGLSNILHSQSLMRTKCGSPHYQAPEMAMRKPYGPKVDVFSMGVILYAILSGCLPFDDPNHSMICQKMMMEYYHMPQYFSQDAQDLIRSMLRPDPRHQLGVISPPWLKIISCFLENRISISKIKKHPWLNLETAIPKRLLDAAERAKLRAGNRKTASPPTSTQRRVSVKPLGKNLLSAIKQVISKKRNTSCLTSESSATLTDASSREVSMVDSEEISSNTTMTLATHTSMDNMLTPRKRRAEEEEILSRELERTNLNSHLAAMSDQADTEDVEIEMVRQDNRQDRGRVNWTPSLATTAPSSPLTSHLATVSMDNMTAASTDFFLSRPTVKRSETDEQADLLVTQILMPTPQQGNQKRHRSMSTNLMGPDTDVTMVNQMSAFANIQPPAPPTNDPTSPDSYLADSFTEISRDSRPHFSRHVSADNLETIMPFPIKSALETTAEEAWAKIQRERKQGMSRHKRSGLAPLSEEPDPMTDDGKEESSLVEPAAEIHARVSLFPNSHKRRASTSSAIPSSTPEPIATRRVDLTSGSADNVCMTPAHNQMMASWGNHVPMNSDAMMMTQQQQQQQQQQQSQVGIPTPYLSGHAFSRTATSMKPPLEIAQEIETVLQKSKISFLKKSTYQFRCTIGDDGRNESYLVAADGPRQLTQMNENLMFELEVFRLPNLPLHVVIYNRLMGDTLAHKGLCQCILDQLNL